MHYEHIIQNAFAHEDKNQSKSNKHPQCPFSIELHRTQQRNETMSLKGPVN